MNEAELTFYRELLADVKGRVRQAQHKAALSASVEMILMYWDIGRMIAARQEREGAGVIPRLALDLKNELPEQKGFSERNIKRMLRFFREYPKLQQPIAKLVPQPAALLESVDNAANAIGPQSAAQFDSVANQNIPPELAFGIPWFHHVILFEKFKDLPTRLWYARQAMEQGWSRDTLTVQIKNRAHERQGAAVSNFAETLPAVHANLAQDLLEDPYLRDIHKPIGIAGYELTRALPKELASSLPSIEAIEAELSRNLDIDSEPGASKEGEP